MNTDIQKFDQLKADVAMQVQHCKEIKVTDKDSSNRAMLEGKKVKHFEKLIEEKRKELTKPHNDRVLEINAYAKSILEPVRNAEKHIKTELAAFSEKLEKERQIEAAKLAEEKRRKEAELAEKHKVEQQKREMEAAFGVDDKVAAKRDELIAKATQEREVAEIQKNAKSQEAVIASNKVAGARKIWDFEVINEREIPRTYLVVSDKHIRAAIAEGITEIPGVRIFQKTSIVLR